MPEPEAVKQAPERKQEARQMSCLEEKPTKVSDTTGKVAKKGQKKGKGKPAVPRQYNLGDYL